MSALREWSPRREVSGGIEVLPGSDPILAKVLYARGLDSPAKLRAFTMAAENALGNPFQMAGVNEAVARLRRALSQGERIVVYGDFDVDGVCATALLVSGLRALGGDVSAYIPDRFSEAYGLNTSALDKLQRQGAGLVVTVDCGIRSVDEVTHARKLGLDMIITDHHSVPSELPPAIAIVDPKQPGCRYPFKELAGTGIAYRLVDALFRVEQRMSRSAHNPLDAKSFLDLVALATVADMVPLVGENRTLVSQGLKHMEASAREGIRALMEVSAVKPGDVDSQAIGFRLGPRINAAGRLEHANLAYQLLMTASGEEARGLASELDGINQRRKQILGEQVEEARALLGEEGDRLVLIVDSPGFHEGIVGLVASRLAEEFYRPALVMRRGEQVTRGSARSIEGLHITHALDSCSDLLLRYGGHAGAAGFSLLTENLTAFRERLLCYCAENLDRETLTRRIPYDAIVSLAEIREDTPVALSAMEPFGVGNPEPALVTENLTLLSLSPVGQRGAHLRLRVGDGMRSLPGIAFRQGHLADSLKRNDKVDLLYRPTLNEWQGQTTLQLLVEDMRAVGTRSGNTDTGHRPTQGAGRAMRRGSETLV